MQDRASNSPENQSRAVASQASPEKVGSEATFQFVDNRPEAIQLRKLQEMADNSPQAKQAAQLQAMIDRSPYSVAQRMLRREGPVQRQDPEEEVLQMNGWNEKMIPPETTEDPIFGISLSSEEAG